MLFIALLRRSFIICLAAVFPLSVAALVAGCGASAVKKTDNLSPKPETAKTAAGTRASKKIKVTLFFGDRQAMYLGQEEREIAPEDKPLVEAVIGELIKGPRSKELVRSIPEGTRLLSAKVTDGIAYVNFSKELQTKHWGGSAGETMTVYSVVNSLAKLDDIREVQFLLEGRKMESLAGHIDMTGPVAPRWDLVAPDRALNPAHSRGRCSGNRITSRIEETLARSMTSRSMPIPSPPAGGMPYSSATIKSSSYMCASSSPACRFSSCFKKRSPWSSGSLSSEKALAISLPAIISSNR